MPANEFKIFLRKGESFAALEWYAPDEPKAIILLIHGLSDHSARYHHVGSYLAASGYGMIAVDLRGNGRSFGKRGHFPSYGRMMDDISLFMKEAGRRHPSVPLFLYGHSMGGNLVLNHLIRNRPSIAGAIVTSPWLRLTVKPSPFKVLLAKMMNRIFPSLTQPDGINPSHLSHDEEVARRYIADPLVHGRISVRTFVEISLAGEYALEHADKIDSPLLLMHGIDDSLTLYSASKELSEKVRVKHTFRAWEGLFHELHNEFEKEVVLGFIRGWLDSVTLSTR